MTEELFNSAQQLKDSIETLETLIRCANSNISFDMLDSKILLFELRKISEPLRKDLLEFAYAKKEEYEEKFNSL